MTIAVKDFIFLQKLPMRFRIFTECTINQGTNQSGGLKRKKKS